MSEADVNACPHLENIRIMTRRVCLKVLGYSRHAIWMPKSAKKSLLKIHPQHLDRSVGAKSVLLLQLIITRRISDPLQPHLHKFFW